MALISSGENTCRLGLRDESRMDLPHFERLNRTDRRFLGSLQNFSNIKDETKKQLNKQIVK
jgi:hypothetical protein